MRIGRDSDQCGEHNEEKRAAESANLQNGKRGNRWEPNDGGKQYPNGLQQAPPEEAEVRRAPRNCPEAR
jgi:hypothetical protein